MIFARKCVSILLIICLLTQNVLASIDVMAPTAGHVVGHLPADYNPSTSDGLITPADSNIKMDRAANGVQVVDINAPNSAGVSHNQFSDFNVGERGVVINNSGVAATSTIGGIVLANPNLVGNRPSNTIINEVISDRVSNIRGATEILGNRADYILANPNGINVNGGEFINIGRAILTTGIPELNSLGALEKITVDKGNISFSKKPGLKGIDLKGLDYFDIISRTTAINAELHMTAELKIVTGRNEYNVRTKAVTPLSHTSLPEQKPSISIDSYNLGGLYAGKIQIVSTEDGVGVNLGNMSSKTQEITVSANGEIRHKNIKSASSLDVTSTKAGIVNTQGSEASATGSIRYEAAGEILNENSRIIASGSNIIVIDARKLTNLGEIDAGSISIKTKGDFHNTGKVTSRGSFNGDIGQNLINNGTIDAIGGDLMLSAGGSIVNTHQITSSSHNVNVNAKGDISNQGIIYAQNNLNLTSSSGSFINFSNAQARSKLGLLDIKAEGAVINHGKLQSELALGIDALSNIYNGISDKQNGEISSNRSIVIKSRSGSIDNRGKIIANDSMQLSSNDRTNNGQDALIKASNIDITSKGDISNLGIIHADKSSVIANSLGGNIINNGEIISLANTNIKALKTITNTGLITSDAGVLDVTATDIDNIGGTLLSPLALSLKSAGSTRNIGGAIESSTYVNIDSIGAINNTGDIQSEGALRLKSRDSSINSGSIKSNGLLEIIASNLVENSGLIKSFTDKTIIDAGSLVNKEEGAIAARLALNVATKTGSVENEGLISSAGNLSIYSIGNIDNAASGKIISLSKAKIYAGKSIENIGEINSEKKLHIRAKTGITNNGEIDSPESIHIKTAGSLTNEKSGSIESGKVLNLTIAGDGTNHGKLLSSGKEVAIEARGNVANIGSIGGKYETARNMPQGVVDPDATGDIATTAVTAAAGEGHLEIRVGGNFINSGLATAKEAEKVEIKAVNIINDGGSIESKNNLKLVASNHVKNIGGHIESSGALTLTSTSGELDNARGTIKSGDVSVITISGDIVNNSGLLESAGNSTITSTAGHLQNLEGKILSGGNLTANIHSRVMNKECHIESKKGLSLSSSEGSLNNELGTIISGANAQIVTVNDIINTKGSIIAVGDAVIKSSFGPLQNDNGEILSGGLANISVGRDIDNRTGHIESNGPLTLTSTSGDLNNTIKGRVISGGLATITVKGNIVNGPGAKLESDHKMTLKTTTGIIDNQGDLISNGGMDLDSKQNMNNRGNITVSSGLLDIKSANFINENEILASGGFKLVGAHVTNNGRITVKGGEVDFDSSGEFKNIGSLNAKAGGKIETRSGGVYNLDNGYINFYDGILTINSPVVVDNKGNIAATQLTINSPDINNKRALFGKTSVTLTGATMENSGIVVGGSVTGSFTELTNKLNPALDPAKDPSGLFYAKSGVLDLNATGVLTNEIGGRFNSKGTMVLGGGSMDNKGTVDAKDGLTVRLSGPLTNGGQLNSYANSDITAASINNTGTVAAKGKLTTNIAGDINNGATIEAGDMELNLSGNLNNPGHQILSAGGIVIKGVRLVNNRAGTIQAQGGSIVINGEAVDNSDPNIGNVVYRVNPANLDGEVPISTTETPYIGEKHKSQFEKASRTGLGKSTVTFYYADGTKDHVKFHNSEKAVKKEIKTYSDKILTSVSGNPGKIIASGSVIFENAAVNNSCGNITAGGAITGNITSKMETLNLYESTFESYYTKWKNDVKDFGDEWWDANQGGINGKLETTPWGEQIGSYPTGAIVKSSSVEKPLPATRLSNTYIEITSPGIISKKYEEPGYGVDTGTDANPATGVIRQGLSQATSNNSVRLSRDGSTRTQGDNPSSARITKTLDELANDVIEFAGRFSVQKPRSKPEDYKSSYLPDPRIDAALSDLNWMEPESPGNHFITEGSIVFTEPGKYYSTKDFMDRIGIGYNTLKDGANSGRDFMHLGDGIKTQLFVQKQIMDKTGSPLLEGHYDSSEMMKHLWDNSYSVMKDYDLTPGISLSGSQIAQLGRDKKNMLWLEFINGVLVARFYGGGLTDEERFIGDKARHYIDIELPEINIGYNMEAPHIRTKSTLGSTTIFGNVRGSKSVVIESAEDVEFLPGAKVSSGGILHANAAKDVRNFATAEAHELIFIGGGNVENRGKASSKRDMTLAADGSVLNIGGALSSGRNMNLSAREDVINETEITRQGHASGDFANDNYRSESFGGLFGDPTGHIYFKDSLGDKAKILVGGNLNEFAGRDIRSIGSITDVQGAANLSAKRDVEILAAKLTEYSESSYAGGDTSSHNKEIHVRHEASNWSAGGPITISAGEGFTVSASKVKSGGDMAITAGAGVLVESLIDTDHTESHYKEDDNSFFGGGESIDQFSFHKESLALASIGSDKKISIKSQGEQAFVGGEVKAEKGTHLKASHISLLSQRIQNSESYSSSDEGLLLQSQEGAGHSNITVEETKLIGPLTIESDTGITAEIRGPTLYRRGSLGFREEMVETGGPSELAKVLEGRTDVQVITVSPTHYSYEYDQTSLTPAGAVLVSAIATVATAGAAGAASQAFVLGANASAATVAGATAMQTAQMAALSAGMTNFASQAAVSIVNNGDLTGVSGKSVVTSMAMAGLSSGITAATGFGKITAPTPGQTQVFALTAKSIVHKSLLDAGLRSAITGQNLGKALEQAGVSAAVHTAQFGVGEVGVAKELADGSLTKTILHAGIGGIAGGATGGENGFAAGALGGAMAEQSSRFIDPHSAAQQQAVGLVSATAAMLASGGSVKAMTSAQAVSIGAIEYNRGLHDEERTVANALKKGKTLEEQHIIDGAAAAAVKMNKSVPDSDEHKAATNELVEIGKQHPEVQAALRAKAIEMGYKDAFVYSWGDSVADKAASFDEVTSRGFGVAKAGLGSKWTMGSARAAAVSASSNTPAGYAIAGALGLATVGNAYYAGSGVQEAFGGYEHKEGARVLGSLTHHVPGYVEQKATSVGIDLAVGAVGYVTGATISMHVTRAALEAKYVGSAALSAKEVVSGAKASATMGSSLDNPLLKNPRVSVVANTEKAGLGSVSGAKVGAAADATKAVKVTAAKGEVVAGEVASVKAASMEIKPRQIPGAATGGESLSIVSDGDKWFRGSHANAAKIPKQIADKMRGQEFKNWDDFRQKVWKLVADDPVLSKNFGERDLAAMKKYGKAPTSPVSQWQGDNTSYNLHHKTPINQGGAVYDFDNITIVTPKYHKEVLDPKYHLGGKK